MARSSCGTGEDEYGHAKGIKGTELLKTKTPYSEASCNKVLICLRKLGWLHSWASDRGYDAHTPVMKLGDIPRLHEKWPDEAPMQSGETLNSTLRKKRNELKAKNEDSNTTTTYRRRTELDEARRQAELRERKERERRE